MDLPVPMTLGVLVERCEHDWENDLNIIADQVTEVLVVPEIQGSFCDLKDDVREDSASRYSVLPENEDSQQTWQAD